MSCRRGLDADTNQGLKGAKSAFSEGGKCPANMGILSQLVSAVWDGAGSCSLQGSP